ncbi:hypothetical protein Ga0100231_013555 [Opitutaceae bacterium TAV4]|nr:hypothetical protein Ga0100231_013555 [Opitutaceae bacterium TAV4]RRJ99438.1 hypothetical protein Ga0100230_014900 [Opitutaceae bacterium TAV3]
MKLKIAVRILGHKPPDLDTAVLTKWHSDLWEIHENKIDTFPLNGDCDLDYWGYSDAGLQSKAQAVAAADFTLYILNVPLEANYYFRRIKKNVGCISLFEVADVLRTHSIPIENLVLRMLYNSTMIHLRKGCLPPIGELAALAHHETKGCIFDMAGIKTDIVFSCHRPILCDTCRAAASADQVSKETIEVFAKEIKGIKKRLYYRAADWVKQKPLLALFASAIFALLLGIAGSLIASYAYEKIQTKAPNQALEPTTMAVTPAASHPSRQP